MRTKELKVASMKACHMLVTATMAGAKKGRKPMGRPCQVTLETMPEKPRPKASR